MNHIEPMIRTPGEVFYRLPILTLVFLGITLPAVFLDVPVLRPVLGFIFLTFLPGWLILRLLRLDTKIDLIEIILYSVGISIAFIMLFGIVINEAYFGIGYDTPLSTNSVLISFTVVIVVMLGILHLRDWNSASVVLPELKVNLPGKWFLILPALLPVLSIFGVHLLNSTGNNSLLIVLLFLIPAYTIFVTLMRHKIDERIYPLMLFFIGLSVCLILGLRTPHILGMDTHFEYRLFVETASVSHWELFESWTATNSCLSISLLPAVYHSLMDLDLEYTMKLLYPVIFSVTPLIVYLIARKYFSAYYAFWAALFFISQWVFIESAALSRNVVAIMFFGYMMLIMFQPNTTQFIRRLLLIVFMTACILSHYSTTYILFFILLFAWLGVKGYKWVQGRRTETDSRQVLPSQMGTGHINVPARTSRLGRHIHYYTFSLVLLLFTITFAWYAQMTQAPFEKGVSFISETFGNLQHFFVTETRGSGSVVLGREIQERGFLVNAEWIFSWLTALLVAVGLVVYVLRNWRWPGLLDVNGDRSAVRRVETEYLGLALSCGFILLVSLILPYVLKYNMQRVYGQMVVMLAPFFIIGSMFIAKYLRTRAYWVIIVIFVPYFMFSTTLMYQIAGVSKNISLSSSGPSAELFMVHDQEISAAKWLGRYQKGRYTRILADNGGRARLDEEVTVPARPREPLVRVLDNNPVPRGYIYLRYSNVKDGEIISNDFGEVGYEGYGNLFMIKDTVYANGGSTILGWEHIFEELE